jgi:dTDP-4-dehydrorhamnose 3,5-epimerase
MIPRMRFAGLTGEHPRESARVSIQRLDTSLPGACELRPKVFRDTRGFFLETYHQAKFAELGIHDCFVQDNHSYSEKGTLRGLHYQLRHPQAKLCRVVEGEALDIALDVRVGSPTFGKWTGVVLSATAQNLIYIPAGFAHGFLALSETVQFLYKCSEFYDPNDEYGIVWNDPDAAIEWLTLNPIISEKDAKNPPLAEVLPELLPRYIKDEACNSAHG